MLSTACSIYIDITFSVPLPAPAVRGLHPAGTDRDPGQDLVPEQEDEGQKDEAGQAAGDGPGGHRGKQFEGGGRRAR